MSLYGNQIQIGGVTCGLVMRGSSNGRYLAVFEREFASLEDIEAIVWDKPDIQGECILPAGYGFTVADIQYSAATKSYTVELQVAQQYLGDVEGYETQVSELEGTVAEQEQALAEKDAAIQSQAQELKETKTTIAQQTQELESRESTIQEQAGTIQAQTTALEEKENTIQSQQETIQALEEGGTARQVEEKLEEAYQEGVESNG